MHDKHFLSISCLIFIRLSFESHYGKICIIHTRRLDLRILASALVENCLETRIFLVSTTDVFKHLASHRC